RQADHWKDSVIVTVMRVYMERMRIYRSKLPTSTSAMLTQFVSDACDCGEVHNSLTVLGIFWDHHETISILTCHRRPAANQLIARGFFPCAPYRPSLAVSLEMLEFATELFARMAPNNRAFAAATEAVLAANGSTFQSEDSLWRRFANTLLHYQILVEEVHAEV
ncbi:uncharacterized protein EI90DRAFT_2834872, partial [Cantharellus anzutake]|uniref:uncharacterized protein n=1 Tax=Cantharellus anzutake TaxID=1750568 RepID=UPI001904413B